MNIAIVSQIRGSEKSQRFEMLVRALCQDADTEPSASDGDDIPEEEILKVWDVVRKMMDWHFYVNDTDSLTFVDKDGIVESPFGVVVTEDEGGRVIRKPTAYVVYDFLRDYLGLGEKPPFTVRQMSATYPDVERDFGGEATKVVWFDTVTKMLLEQMRQTIATVGLAKA